MLSSAAPGLNPSPGALPVAGQFLILGTTTTNAAAQGVHMTAFIPSFRFMTTTGSQTLAARTASRTFVKGFSEQYHIVPSDASAWEWRRIVVSSKGGFQLPVEGLAIIGAQFVTGNTTYRYMKDVTGDSSGSYQTLWDSAQTNLFYGVKNVDWIDQMTAKLDRTRFNVHSDVTRVISSGNDSSRPRSYRTYQAVNKTIQYDDEENGVTMLTSPISVDSKIGLGDIYVYDLFTCRAPINAVSTQLQVRSNMTYYWHEK